MAISQINEFERILNRMRIAVGAENNDQLAKILGYKSTGTISNWKRAKGGPKIPQGALAMVSQISKIPICDIVGEIDLLSIDKDFFKQRHERLPILESHFKEAIAEYKSEKIVLSREENALLKLFRNADEETKDRTIDTLLLGIESAKRRVG